MAILHVRLTDTEYNDIKDKAIQHGFSNKDGTANVTAYIKFITKNVKIKVEA